MIDLPDSKNAVKLPFFNYHITTGNFWPHYDNFWSMLVAQTHLNVICQGYLEPHQQSPFSSNHFFIFAYEFIKYIIAQLEAW